MLRLMLGPGLLRIHELVLHELAVAVDDSTADVGIILHFNLIVNEIRHVLIGLLLSPLFFI